MDKAFQKNSTMSEKINSRMDIISKTFQISKQMGFQNTTWDEFKVFLEKQDLFYHALVFEGASMGYAQYDKYNNGRLTEWKKFTEKTPKAFNTFNFIGLGWALAKWTDFDLTTLKDVDVKMYWRTFGGWGYHDAIFKKSLIFNKMDRAHRVPLEYVNAYDEGIGRLIWYESRADLQKMMDLVSRFDKSRLPDIWRGIGIAVSFVGAYDLDFFKKILNFTGDFRLSFNIGSALAAKALDSTHTVNNEVEGAFSYMFDKSISEIAQMTIKLENETTSDDYYSKWLQKMHHNMVSYIP